MLKSPIYYNDGTTDCQPRHDLFFQPFTAFQNIHKRGFIGSLNSLPDLVQTGDETVDLRQDEITVLNKKFAPKDLVEICDARDLFQAVARKILRCVHQGTSADGSRDDMGHFAYESHHPVMRVG